MYIEVAVKEILEILEILRRNAWSGVTLWETYVSAT